MFSEVGAWKNYDELEETLTIEELTETYTHIVEEETRNMEFQASVAGAEIKGKSSSGKKEESSLQQRVRERAEREKQERAKSGKRTEFSRGLGYRVIGGG